MRKHSLILAIMALSMTSCAHLRILPIVPAASDDRATVIHAFFEDRSLDPVEGIWLWDTNEYEVAIVKNTFGIFPNYEYVAFLTDTRRSGWKIGEVKIALKSSASPTVYSGIYFMGDKTEQGTTFLMSHPNLIEMRLPTGPYGSKQTTLLIRAYPASAVAGSPSRESSAESSGTGFFVARNLIATNYHVVEDAEEVIATIAGEAVRAEMVLRDARNDLAILRIPDRSWWPLAAECLRIGDASTVRAGDRAFTLSFPLAGLLASSINVSEGIVNTIVGIHDDPRIFQISIPIQPGSSGSPLINTRGEVIGVVTSTLNNRYLFEQTGTIPQNVNFAVKASYLANLLQLLPEAICETGTAIDLSARDVQECLSPAVVPIRARR